MRSSVLLVNEFDMNLDGYFEFEAFVRLLLFPASLARSSRRSFWQSLHLLHQSTHLREQHSINSVPYLVIVCHLLHLTVPTGTEINRMESQPPGPSGNQKPFKIIPSPFATLHPTDSTSQCNRNAPAPQRETPVVI